MCIRDRNGATQRGNCPQPSQYWILRSWQIRWVNFPAAGEVGIHTLLDDFCRHTCMLLMQCPPTSDTWWRHWSTPTGVANCNIFVICHSLQLRHWLAASYYHDGTNAMPSVRLFSSCHKSTIQRVQNYAEPVITQSDRFTAKQPLLQSLGRRWLSLQQRLF